MQRRADRSATVEAPVNRRYHSAMSPPLCTARGGAVPTPLPAPVGSDPQRTLLPMRASSYLLLVCLGFAALLGLRELNARAIELSCWAGGYSQDAWLAYCNSKRYGVYEVEAIWHRIEPDVAPAIARAQVLTLSDSHLQTALSLGGASDWFRAHAYRLYLLGLPTEESGFGEDLLDNFQPHPAVVIFDASPYFTGAVGPSESNVVSDPQGARAQVLRLKRFQHLHERFCDWLPSACGHNFAYFRSRLDGHLIFPQYSTRFWIGKRGVPTDTRRFPVSGLPDESQALYPTYLAAARRLLGKLDLPRSCMVITSVPAQRDERPLARYLSGELGLTLIDPDLPGLSTYDRTHLTPDSSRRWTQAFLRQLEPVLRSCVGKAAAAAPAPRE